MSCYPEPGSHIRGKVKVVLDLSNSETKKELEHATGVVINLIELLKNFIWFKSWCWETRH